MDLGIDQVISSCEPDRRDRVSIEGRNGGDGTVFGCRAARWILGSDRYGNTWGSQGRWHTVELATRCVEGKPRRKCSTGDSSGVG